MRSVGFQERMILFFLVLLFAVLFKMFSSVLVDYYLGNIKIASNANSHKVLKELVFLIPKERLLWRKDDVLPHSLYKSINVTGNPDIVVFPIDVDEVMKIIRICYANDMIVVPMGLNTAVEGQTVTQNGGVVINMMQMNKILEIYPEDYQASVEPGVRVSELNTALKEHGLFFPVSPSSNPSIGGSAGTRGSGMLTPQYLTIKENIVSLEAVLANGDLIQTGRRSLKSSAGFDLTSLFVGSEGTLGIITKLVVRAVPIPNAISAATVHFESIHDASSTVSRLVGLGNNGILRMELVNKPGIQSLNEHMGTNHEVHPSLFLEFSGESDEDVSQKSDKARMIAEELGGRSWKESSSKDEMELLWKTRMSAFYAFSNCREDCKDEKKSCRLFATDYCVPISNLGKFIEFCDNLFEKEAPQFKGNLVVHAADGNLHHGVLIDYNNPQEVKLMNKIHQILLKKTLQLEGTIAGEHGIGVKMKENLKMEFNEATIGVMKRIKEALDPKNMMNPGKIV